MKRKTKMTGIALSLCIAMSSFAPVQVNADTTVTKTQVQKEVQAAATYIQGFLEEEKADIISYRELILMMQAGIDCKVQYNDWLSALKNCMTDDGKILYEGTENPVFYAAAIDILTLGGENPADFEGCNLVKSFHDYILSYSSAEEFNTALGNPYYYSYIIPVAEGYAPEFEDSERLLSILKEAMFCNYQNTDEGCGIYYWGFSTDNNAKVLSAAKSFCSTDKEVSQKVQSALAWTKSLQMNDGSFKLDKQEWSVTSNADSTAYALELFSVYDDEKTAADAYCALMSFQSPSTKGCYTYNGEDSYFSSIDALEGLVSYYLYLCGRNASPFYTDAYSEKTCTISYHANGGKIGKNSVSKVTLKNGEKLHLPAAVRSGYILKGWYTKKSGGNQIKNKHIFTAAKDTSYYAHWTKISLKKASITSFKRSSSKKLKLTIKKVSGAEGYEILTSSKSNFKDSKRTVSKKTSVTITGLPAKKNCYVKVRACQTDSTGKKIYGAYSSVKKVSGK